MLQSSTEMTVPCGRKVAALDGVRGLAIILVLLHHFQRYIASSNVGLRATKALFEYGWVGVDLFFALSGFLITGILLDTRKSQNYFSAFYARRVLRIFPLYYMALLAVLAAAAVIKPTPTAIPLAADRKLYFIYLTNWLVLWKGQWGPNVIGHFWSLAVEEQFYLVWPLCVWALLSRNVARVAVGFSIVALLVRVYWLMRTGPSQAIVMATVTRMDSLLCGAFAAVLFRNQVVLRRLRRFLPTVSLVAILMFSAGIVSFAGNPAARDTFAESTGFSLLAIGFSALVLYAAATEGSSVLTQRVFSSRVLTDFGKYSYGIYVYHIPVLGACEILLYRHLPLSLVGDSRFGVLYFVFLIAASFVVAKVSYECLERHFLALKRYFEPMCARRTEASVNAVAALGD